MNNPQSVNHDDEIDLLELIKVLWDEKIKIIAITAVAAFISVIYAFLNPIYIKRRHL